MVALTAALCINGMWWGWTEIWNADQMAFKNHFREGYLPFSPSSFSKPPLFSYFNFVFSAAPRELLALTLEYVTGNEYGDKLDFVGVWLAKTWQTLFACGSVYLLWRIVANFGDRASGIIPSLLLASSAGFIVQAHLITTDLPVVFFMLVAFWAAQKIVIRGEMRDYVLAGLLVGLTGAMKYNGLVIGIAIPVFHFFRVNRVGLAAWLLHPGLIAAAALVPVGFFLGNPFALIEFDRFVGDLTYLFATSPEFIGASGDSTRDPNIAAVLANDLVGWPLFLTLVAALPVSVYLIVKEGRSCRSATVWAACLTAGIYASYFSTRTNLQVRWVLAIVPFALVTFVPFWQYLRVRMPLAVKIFTALLISYGIVCSIWVGLRFTIDPRNDAVDWVGESVPPGAVIESSPYTPRWNRHREIDIVNIRMPAMSGRRRIFEKVFSDDPRIMNQLQLREKENIYWYSTKALESRRPDYIAMSSIYYNRYTSGRVAEAYPELKNYFTLLLKGDTAYEVGFDRSCCRPISILYPHNLLFVDHRLVILSRR